MKSKVIIILICIVVTIILVTSLIYLSGSKNEINVNTNIEKEESNSIDNENNNNTIENNTAVENKYYLHDSTLELPSDTKCKEMKAKIIEGLTDKEINLISKKVREAHVTMEYLLIDGVRLLKNPESKYWELYANSTMIIEDTGAGLDFSQEYCFRYVLNCIKDIKDIVKDNNAKEILSNLSIEFEKALNECNLAKCFEIHKTIHDVDYFIINYPAQFDINGAAPPDWEGIRTYFGIEI